MPGETHVPSERQSLQELRTPDGQVVGYISKERNSSVELSNGRAGTGHTVYRTNLHLYAPDGHNRYGKLLGTNGLEGAKRMLAKHYSDVHKHQISVEGGQVKSKKSSGYGRVIERDHASVTDALKGRNLAPHVRFAHTPAEPGAAKPEPGPAQRFEDAIKEAEAAIESGDQGRIEKARSQLGAIKTRQNLTSTSGQAGRIRAMMVRLDAANKPTVKDETSGGSDQRSAKGSLPSGLPVGEGPATHTGWLGRYRKLSHDDLVTEHASLSEHERSGGTVPKTRRSALLSALSEARGEKTKKERPGARKTTAQIAITNEGKSARGQYQADLHIGGQKVGRIERGMRMGAGNKNEYEAIVDGRRVATARSLNDLKADIRDWWDKEGNTGGKTTDTGGGGSAAEAAIKASKIPGNRFGTYDDQIVKDWVGRQIAVLHDELGPKPEPFTVDSVLPAMGARPPRLEGHDQSGKQLQLGVTGLRAAAFMDSGATADQRAPGLHIKQKPNGDYVHELVNREGKVEARRVSKQRYGYVKRKSGGHSYVGGSVRLNPPAGHSFHAKDPGGSGVIPEHPDSRKAHVAIQDAAKAAEKQRVMGDIAPYRSIHDDPASMTIQERRDRVKSELDRLRGELAKAVESQNLTLQRHLNGEIRHAENDHSQIFRGSHFEEQHQREIRDQRPSLASAAAEVPTHDDIKAMSVEELRRNLRVLNTRRGPAARKALASISSELKRRKMSLGAVA